MIGTAHISFEGGGLVVPVGTSYQREILLEHIEVSTKRHGLVALLVNRQEWTVRLRSGPREACTACGRWLERLIYRFRRESLCGPCARRVLI